MAHTFTTLLVHATFSTKDRVPVLKGDVGQRVFAYMGGIVRELGAKPFTINGPADHVHFAFRLPPTVCVSDAMRVVKTNSSRWANEQGLGGGGFGWQSGYGAFSVSESNREAVSAYIEDQEEHHKKRDFNAEFEALLRRHGIAYDEAHLWG